MKNYFFILSTLLIVACGSPSIKKDPNLNDLNIYTTSDLRIDSVFISDIGQQREFYFLPYKDTLNIPFNDSINDLYNLIYYTSKGRISNQIWLDGEEIIIQATVDDKLKIDTVIGSNLYYESLQLKNEISTLYRERNRTKLIDQFFMEKISDYIDSPLSIMLCSNYLYRLQNDQKKIATVVSQLETQSPMLRDHPISSYNALMKLLNTKQIDLHEFDFISINNEITPIKKIDKEQRYLLDFWFVNCVPCVQDHKIIASEMDFLTKNNIELQGISIDEDHQKWKEYLDEHEYTWPNYREMEHNRLTKKMDITAYPTYYLLDYTGAILYRSNSYNDVRNFILDN